MNFQSLNSFLSGKVLCIDARMYQHSGIGVYLLQLIEDLKDVSNLKIILLVPDLNIPAFEFFEKILFEKPIYSISEQLAYPYVIPDCDVFWSPHYNVPLLPIRAKKRWVTIHDVFHLRYAHTLGVLKRLYAKLSFFAACKFSERIFTVSQFSKDEIVSFFKDSQSKIEVIYNKVNVEKFSKQATITEIFEVKKKYNIDQGYVLFVGNVKPHKNLITLLKAFNEVKVHVEWAKLLIVGKKEGFITQDNEVGRYLEEHVELKKAVIFTGFVDDNDLPVLYQMARVFVFPSLYEGFGYPPLEAHAAGIPVICSNAGPMPEVCGDKVEYFNPLNVKELAEKISSHFNS